MQLKSVVSILTLVLSVTACSSINKIVYRIDVPQGNYLEANTVAQVQPGMTAQQVKYLLGTPVLIDPYSRTTWYYVFLQQKAYQAPDQHTFVVNFDQQGIVTQVDLDKPLPNNDNDAVNNTIINASEADKSWWQFWK